MYFPEIDYRKDPQQAVPLCYCAACRGEIYTEESAVVIDGEYFCEDCYAGENDEEIIQREAKKCG